MEVLGPLARRLAREWTLEEVGKPLSPVAEGQTSMAEPAYARLRRDHWVSTVKSRGGYDRIAPEREPCPAGYVLPMAFVN